MKLVASWGDYLHRCQVEERVTFFVGNW